MKNIIISADGERMVYSVPNEAAENLYKYCMEFCTIWLQTSKHAEKYRKSGGVYYDENDTFQLKSVKKIQIRL